MREKRRVGFAAMKWRKQRELARLGGIASHKTTGPRKPHQWTPAEARAMGKLGGRPRKHPKPAPAPITTPVEAPAPPADAEPIGEPS